MGKKKAKKKGSTRRKAARRSTEPPPHDEGLGQEEAIVSAPLGNTGLGAVERPVPPDILDPTAGEPILSFIARGGTKSLSLVCAGLLVLAAVPVLAAVFEGKFVSVEPRVFLGLSANYPYYLNLFVGTPLVVIFTTRYCSRFDDTLQTLCKRSIVTPDPTKYRYLVRSTNSLFGHEIAVLLPLLVAVVGQVLTTHTYVFTKPNMWTYHSASGWLMGIPQILFYYFLGVAVVRIGLSYVTISRFFHFQTQLQPLHPDGCGGLYPLGQLFVQLFPVLLFIGVSIVLGIYQDVTWTNEPPTHFTNVSSIALFVAAAVAVMALPLHAAHHKMKDSKKRTIDTLNTRLASVHARLMKSLGDEALKVEILDELERLRSLYKAARKMAVYPVDAKIALSYVLTIGLPIAAFVLQVVGMFMAAR